MAPAAATVGTTSATTVESTAPGTGAHAATLKSAAASARTTAAEAAAVKSTASASTRRTALEAAAVKASPAADTTVTKRAAMKTAAGIDAATAKFGTSAHAAECAAILERRLQSAEAAVRTENGMLPETIAVNKRFTICGTKGLPIR